MPGSAAQPASLTESSAGAWGSGAASSRWKVRHPPPHTLSTLSPQHSFFFFFNPRGPYPTTTAHLPPQSHTHSHTTHAHTYAHTTIALPPPQAPNRSWRPLLAAEYKFVEICEGGDLYCLNFPSEDFDTSDGGSFDGNSSSSGGGSGGGDGGQPLSLCLPLPDGCGEAGGVCCPLTGNKTNGSLRCQADNSICMAPQSDTIYGLLTYELYTQLGQDPQASLSGEVALSLWGTCQTFDPQQCGTPGSLCGASLAPPGPQCPEDARDCPDG